MENIVDITSFLTWVAGVGSVMVAGNVVSLLAENWPKWHTLNKTVKTVVPMILSFLLAMGAQALLNWQMPGQVEYWANVAILWFWTYLGNQAGYMNAKVHGYARGVQDIG